MAGKPVKRKSPPQGTRPQTTETQESPQGTRQRYRRSKIGGANRRRENHLRFRQTKERAARSERGHESDQETAIPTVVLELSGLAGQQIRISSVVREGDPGHHGRGRAADIGNEEIAGTLLPRAATNAQVAALEIDEIIFDATVAGQTDRNKWNYDLGVKHNYDSTTLNQHRNHIHFAVKAG